MIPHFPSGGLHGGSITMGSPSGGVMRSGGGLAPLPQEGKVFHGPKSSFKTARNIVSTISQAAKVMAMPMSMYIRAFLPFSILLWLPAAVRMAIPEMIMPRTEAGRIMLKVRNFTTLLTKVTKWQMVHGLPGSPQGTRPAAETKRGRKRKIASEKRKKKRDILII